MVKPYRHNVGDIGITVIHAGGRDAPIEQYAGNFHGVSVEDFKQARAEMGMSTETTELSMNPFLIEVSGQRILVDTGLGGEDDAVVAGLAKIGIQPSDIDTVFITHLHPDHFLGLLKPDGTLTYPKATVKMAEQEWNGWMSEEALEALAKRDEYLATRLKDKMMPVKEQTTLELVDFGDAIAPGVTTFAAVGHTPGHTGLMIESNGEKLFCFVDVAHQTVQLPHIDWCIKFDSSPEITPQTRETVFSRAADEDLLTLSYHFPFPGIGRIVREKDAFRWDPVTG